MSVEFFFEFVMQGKFLDLGLIVEDFSNKHNLKGVSW